MMQAIRRTIGLDRSASIDESQEEDRLSDVDRRLDEQDVRLNVLELEVYGRIRRSRAGDEDK
jgi:hypothetical protein